MISRGLWYRLTLLFIVVLGAGKLGPAYLTGKETKDMGGDPDILVSAQDSKSPRALTLLASPFVRLQAQHLPVLYV